MGFILDQTKQTVEQLNVMAKAEDSQLTTLAREALQQATDALSQMFGPRPSTPGLEDVVLNYYRFQRLSCGLTEERARQEVDAEFETARLKHPDFEEYRTAMVFVAYHVVPDMRVIVGALSLDQYLEILYTAAKHADFLGFRDGRVS
jgi:hypothetical protein